MQFVRLRTGLLLHVSDTMLSPDLGETFKSKLAACCSDIFDCEHKRATVFSLHVTQLKKKIVAHYTQTHLAGAYFLKFVISTNALKSSVLNLSIYISPSSFAAPSVPPC